MAVETIAARVGKIQQAKSLKEIVEVVMTTLHDVAGAYYSRRVLEELRTGEKKALTPVLLRSIQEKAITDDAIEQICLDVWEAAALRMNELEKELGHGNG